MAGIKISKALKSKLPEEQREDLEDRLWEQSGGKCYLCGEEMNRASDEIQADHDEAEFEDGETKIENLNLAHRSCNAAKKNNPTIDIKPYLRLTAFIRKHDGPVRYGECAKHFGIQPKPSVISRPTPNSVRIELSDGTIAECPVYVSKNAAGTFEYCFVQVPREALFNDDECQPRNIKLAQAWAIYVDLKKNPLHEPPGCRIITEGGRSKLAMFDGQHKTVASWMDNQQTIVVKLYLNISLPQTIRLVNSVQAKIKKLPLSPFEIAAKLADEWQGQLSEYENDVGAENMSERGFIDWLKPTDRTRGKAAFLEARIQNLLDRSDDLLLMRFIKHGSAESSDEALIPEATFKTKVLKEMIHTKPLLNVGDDGEARRGREAENIIKVLNYFAAKVFEPNGDGIALNETQKETRRRFAYQASLKFVGEMLRKVVANICLHEADTVFLDAKFSDDQWKAITAAIDRMVAHPIWSKDFKIGPKAKAVEEAILKNQGAKEALAAAGLTFGYIAGGETLSSDWYK